MEYSDYLETRTLGSALSGDEKMGMSQGGDAMQWTPALMAEYLRTLGLNPYTFPFPQFTTTTSTTAYAGTPSPAISAYATGQKFQVKVHATSTGDATLNLNAIGAKKWFKSPTEQATTGDLIINQIYIVVYDAALDTAAGGFLMVGIGGSGGWAKIGTTVLNGDTVIDNDVHNLLIGDISGPWSSWDIDGSGPTTIPNSRSDGIGDPAGTTHSYLRHAVNGDDSEALLSVKNATGSEESYIVVGASSAPSINLGTTGEVNINTDGAQRLSVHPNGSWRLGVAEDAGTAGYVLQSNGASAEPTWEAPTGGGGGTWGSITGTLSSQTDLQTALDAKLAHTNSAGALTDGAAITLTATKHTLTSVEAAITFSITYAGDDITIKVILNAATATYTFPAGSLCVVEGTASGANTMVLTGTSGDEYMIAIKNMGTKYMVVCKNFGQ